MSLCSYHILSNPQINIVAGSDDTSKGNVKETKSANPGGDNIQIKGKNTFAVPRNVRPLGWISNKPKNEDDEKPKSNDEFRKMFIKKE